MMDRHTQGGELPSIPAVSRLLLNIAWHIRDGAAIPVCINNLSWPAMAVSIQLDAAEGVKDWARRFGLGLEVTGVCHRGYICAASELADVHGRRIEFWSMERTERFNDRRAARESRAEVC